MKHAPPAQRADQAGFAEAMWTAGYQVYERIGAGETGDVFRAHHTRFGRQVALKKILPHLAADPELKKCFIKESLAAAAIGHEHIITTYDVAEVRGMLYVAMRYLPDGDVGSMIRRQAQDGKRLPAERVAEIVRQVASALDAAHSDNLMHGHVKPTKMLLEMDNPDGDLADHIYLASFGLGNVSVHSAGARNGARFDGAVGYLSPEQLAGRPADSRSDQYSLGCSAFEMLTGRPALRDIAGHLASGLPVVTSLRPDLPGGVGDVFGKVLATGPATRFTNCGEFADRLADALASRPRSARVPEPEWSDIQRPAQTDSMSLTEPARDERDPVDSANHRSCGPGHRARSRLARFRSPLSLGFAAAVVVGAVLAINYGSSPTSSSQRADGDRPWSHSRVVITTNRARSGTLTSGATVQGTTSLTWWNNAASGHLAKVYQTFIQSFQAIHPNWSITAVGIRNEQLRARIPLALQSGHLPDIFQQWGGGNEASQVMSGKIENLTKLVSSWIGELGGAAAGWQVHGQQYGVPYALHVVGFWYRKDLFARAGISGPPTTIAELDADVTKLKAAGIVPIAVGSKDQWPDSFYWDYFAVRECPITTLKLAVTTGSANYFCFVKAGNDLRAFLATHPFQAGFLGAPSQVGARSSAALLANGGAAMELQGDWEPGVLGAQASGHKVLSELGWFPFPAVVGAAGSPTALLGSGDGFSCSTSAPEPACADFLAYLDSPPVQRKLFSSIKLGLPANPAAASALTLPAEKQILQLMLHTSYVQTSFDVAYRASVGQALDNAVAAFFAGHGTPQTIVAAVDQAAAQQPPR